MHKVPLSPLLKQPNAAACALSRRGREIKKQGPVRMKKPFGPNEFACAVTTAISEKSQDISMKGELL